MNGWLLTDGWDAGVSKAVGEATRQSQQLIWQSTDSKDLQNKIHCIGICPWNSLHNKKCLINENPEVRQV